MSVRELVLKHLEDSKSKNPQFSLRGLARKLQISPASLSQIISGKRNLTLKTAKKICERLSVSPDEAHQAIFSSAISHHGENREELRLEQLRIDHFRVIADWYHLAILSLTEIRGSQPTAKWVSKRLGISVQIAEDAMSRLQRVGLLEIKGRKWRQATPQFSIASKTPEPAIRKFHHQILDRAKDSLDRDPVEEREFGVMVMAIDPARIDEARKLMLRFRKELSQFLEKGEKSRAYALAVQLFPLDKP